MTVVYQPLAKEAKEWMAMERERMVLKMKETPIETVRSVQGAAIQAACIQREN